MMADVFFPYAARNKFGWFAPQSLGMRLEADGGSVVVDSTKVVRTELPDWFARDDKYPPIGALAALLDEASTYSVTAHDKTGRFGVSVQIAVDLVDEPPPLGPRAPLLFETIPTKIGKTLAFAHINVFSSGHLVLRGTHIKYLPGQFDFLGWPSMFPLVKAYYDTVVSTWPLHKDPGDVLAHVADTALLHVDRCHCNPSGAFHGGAACITAERIAAASIQSGHRPIGMTVDFLSSLKPGDAARLLATPSDASDIVHATIRTPSDKPAVDARVRFRPQKP